jgi:hypothetical protein
MLRFVRRGTTIVVTTIGDHLAVDGFSTGR